MLELVLLYRLCIWIGSRAREKGQSAIRYQCMLILYWIGGEFGTALVTSTLFALLYEEEIPYLFVYMVAYIGGSIGASFVFKIVAKLPDLNITEVRASEANV